MARVPAADVRVSADEPALLHFVDRTICSACFAGLYGLGPERRFEVIPMLIQRERMKGVFVVETQVSIQEPILMNLGFYAP